MKSGKLLLGLVSGAVAGAVVGLLYAPKKGTDTRKAISEKGDDYLKGANRSLNDFTNSVNHKMEALKARTKATVAGSKSEEKINKAKAEMHEVAS
ncbi:YtxH domain-containing protein [Christiangramia sp. SM2212]|uniref:YtxH domain-containing protein n=1 Tax=Christiangramia sediminicola TaxID=3073267 RepID=A0ABU1ENS3_9FLAO|nr:YtxH domain-containing protein [Christiangramia sp. SM2212]MDR5590022.1 YtxH domain-containing protein [Christiangramia sp. SM2212]